MNKITAVLATFSFALLLFVLFTHNLYAQDIIDKPKALAAASSPLSHRISLVPEDTSSLHYNHCSSKRVPDRQEEIAGAVGCLIPVGRTALSTGIPVIKQVKIEDKSSAP